MHCVYPLCGDDEGISQDITLYKFPHEASLRTEWLTALGKAEGDLVADSAVCSKHFIVEDFFETSSGRKLRLDAVPVVYVEAPEYKCRICMATDCKLYSINDDSQFELWRPSYLFAYEDLSELSVEQMNRLPPYLCARCGNQLIKCVRFKRRSMRANSFLMEYVADQRYAAAAGSGAGVGSDCDGEDQEDSSSSHSGDLLEAQQALELLALEEEEINNGPEDELSVFRQQWQRELEATPSPQREKPLPVPVPMEAPCEEPLTEEDRAKQLFLRGVEMERGGKLYEAIQHYKRAIQILPDVETRLYESTELRSETPTEDIEPEEVIRVEAPADSDDEDAVEGEDLLGRLTRFVDRKGTLCEPAVPTKGAHISWLPYEVMQLVLRWVVSSELDAGSLERCAAVCRGLHVCARDPALWRALCVRTWGIECGVPRALGFWSWRHMYVERPRVRLHGCYISRTSYLRHGENSFQDQFYRPWYLIEYYRYLRFFPEGLVLSWTTAEEPATCVSQLRSRTAKSSLGIMVGHYRLVGERQVVIVVKKASEARSVRATPTNTRFRARKQPQEPDQTFHMELELCSARGHRNWQLRWRRYAVAARRGAGTAFELPPARYPPYAFSPVRTYTAHASAPLHTNI